MSISSDATCDDTSVVKGVMSVDQHIHIHNSHKISMGLSDIDETLANFVKRSISAVVKAFFSSVRAKPKTPKNCVPD